MSSNKIEIIEILTLVQSNGALRIAYSIYLFSKLSLRHVFDNKQVLHLLSSTPDGSERAPTNARFHSEAIIL